MFFNYIIFFRTLRTIIIDVLYGLRIDHILIRLVKIFIINVFTAKSKTELKFLNKLKIVTFFAKRIIIIRSYWRLRRLNKLRGGFCLKVSLFLLILVFIDYIFDIIVSREALKTSA